MKIAKLFQNGRSQAVRLPKEFQIVGKEVYVRKIGDLIVLMPPSGRWGNFFESLGEFSDDFMKDRKQPNSQDRDLL